MSRIALIGGAGFCGHHLALRLRRRHEVLIIDSLSVNNKYVITDPVAHAIINERLDLLRQFSVPVAIVDARDYHMLSRLLSGFKPDCIVHLAAVAHIDRSNKDPHSTFDHSLRTLENTLDVARSIGCPHVIYFSSSTVYGDFSAPVYDERSPCKPKGIYGAIKLAGELIVRAYGETGGPDWTIIRPCALYGPRCISGRVIQKFIEAAKAGETCRVVPGKVDFTYVDDLTGGVELAINDRSARNQTFNMTAGNARTLTEVVDVLKRYFPHADFRVEELDPERPMRGTLSCDLARKLLGYKPEFQIERGMAVYVDWYRHLWQR